MSSGSPLSSVTDPGELFDLLESSRPSTVTDIKNLIFENLNQTKESWLVSGLFDYYTQTNSERCIEILNGIKEPHDKYLIEKITEGLRTQVHRKQSLNLLGHVVRKQPSWLYKITQHGLLKELIKILKIEADVVVLVSGLLIVITILPIIPTYINAYVIDIFDVFSRLATWTHTNNQDLAEEQVLHLQVGLYALFHRLYGMYPCSFLSYLRRNFGAPDKTLTFHHTIKPMLETVRMHPLLVTATRELELAPQRWKSKEYHDVMAECSKFSLSVSEAGDYDETSFRPRLASVVSTSDLQASNQITNFEFNELTNLTSYVEDSGNNLITPLTNTSQATLTLTPPNADETAMEATPENTPLQTPVKDRERLVFKMPDRASSAAVHLNFGSSNKIYTTTSGSGNVPAAPASTPANSVPTSPLPQLESVSRRDSAGESLLARRDSLFTQRLQKMLHDQQQQQLHAINEQKNFLQPGAVNDIDAPQEPPGGPLTPLIQPSAEFMEEPPPPCYPESSKCKGGLHMPDSQSLIAFATQVKRMRFYSQCENSVGESSWKRSLSCPEIKEESEEGIQTQTVESTKESKSRPYYEHMFETLTDVWGKEDECKSPEMLLDECIKKAALAHDNTKNIEQRLRAQVELLHGQLQFERHRREAHTLRNRRLASKVRKSQNCEEQNSSYKIQIHQLEKEIASLKKEITRQRTAAGTKEADLQSVIEDLRSKLKVTTSTIKNLELEKSELTSKVERLTVDYETTKRDLDEKLAAVFSLESNMSHYHRYAAENEELKKACEIAQRNILVLGELCRSQDEVLKSVAPIEFKEDIELVKCSYEEEIKGLKHTIDSTTSQYEASLAYIQDLEASLCKKDKVIEDLKKLAEDIAAEYQAQLRATEDKYESAKAINHRLELDILNLNSLVALKKLTGPTSPKATTSAGDPFMRNGVSPTDSDVTVESAASAGGFGGLSSPERNQFIFGSPQFENPSEEMMSDLRKAIE